MADYFSEPKTNWLTSDGIGYADLNKIGENISSVRDAGFRGVDGFDYSVYNDSASYDGIIEIGPGSCYSTDGFPIKHASTYKKNLTTWAEGSGENKGGVASAVTVAANTWYYIFVIMDPTDGSTDIMIDDNVSGSNVSNGTYTKKRYVGAVKTGLAGTHSSFDFIEMYSRQNWTYINPYDMFPLNSLITYSNSAGINDTYQAITLQTAGSEGYLLPAKEIRALLNVRLADLDEAAFISLTASSYGAVITPPVSGVNISGVNTGEVALSAGGSGALYSAQVEVMFNSSRQVLLGLYEAGSGGSVGISVRGFYDERLQ